MQLITAGTDDSYDTFIDDLHFTGKIVHECCDASAITATAKERQLFLRMDTAVDDTLNTTNNTGTAALLCMAELFKRIQTPIVGKITVNMMEDLLPGQTLCIYAGRKADGTYRFNGVDMRVKELKHTVSNRGFLTEIDLTSDTTNSHASGTPDAWQLLKEYAGALSYGEAKDFKVSGIGTLIPRLSWDPT